MQGQDTRFQPPRISTQQVSRRRLLRQVRHEDPRRLTAIVAPAGYGKTSFAAEWFGVLKTREIRAAWVQLDASDRDPGQFLRTLLSAVTHWTLGHPPRHDLEFLSPASIWGLLANAVAAVGGPLCLFLDDVHAAQSDAVEGLLARLLAPHASAALKLVLISRTMPAVPLSALALQGEVRQVTVADLRFSKTEAQDLFGSLARTIGKAEIEFLTERTDGWAVALQTARVLAADGSQPFEALASLAIGSPEMARYLSEHVLSRLQPPLLRLLLETSALPTVCAELAAAVTGRPEDAALFQEIERHGLPVAVFGEHGRWIAYHPVFNAFLKEEAARRGVDGKPILRRAALWFQALRDSEGAVRHALAAGDVALAAGIVEAAGGWRQIYGRAQGQIGMFRALVARTAEIDLATVPLTTLGFAIVSAKAGDTITAAHYLQAIERGVDAGDADRVREVRAVGGLLALYDDQRLDAGQISAIENDLAGDEGLDLVHRALLLNLLSFNYLIRSDLDDAIAYGRRAIQCFHDSGAGFGALHLHVHIGQACLFSGDMAGAETAYRHLIDGARADLGQGSDLEAMGQVLFAELACERGETGLARDALAWALPHLERHDCWFDLLAAGVTTRQRLHLTATDFAAGHDAIDAALAVARRRNFHRLTKLLNGERVRLLLAAGDGVEADRYARHFIAAPEAAFDRAANDLATRLRGSVPALLWCRLWLQAGDRSRARRAYDRLTTMQAKAPHVVRQIELALLEIRLLETEGRRDAAQARLADLVLSLPCRNYATSFRIEGAAVDAMLRQLVEGPGVSAIVRDRLGAILADPRPESLCATAGGGGKRDDGPFEMTRRELGVIRLLSTGCTNKDIGRRLQLSDNTVKFHLRNIFTKLNVSTRTGAVSAARSLGVVP